MKETFLSCMDFVFEDFSNEERIGQDMEHLPCVRSTARDRERESAVWPVIFDNFT